MPGNAEHSPEELPLEIAALVNAAPSFARHVLCLGALPDALSLYFHASRMGCMTQHAETDTIPQHGPRPDLVLWAAPPEPVLAPLRRLKSLIDPCGRLCVLLPTGPGFAESERAWMEAAGQAHWLRYQETGVSPSEETGLLTFVHEGYDALEHATSLAASGHAEWACEVLKRLPLVYLRTPETFLNVFAEHLLSLLQWAKRMPKEAALDFAAVSQDLFNRITALDPHFHPAYQCKAEFWRDAGRPDMAARILRSVEHVAPSEPVRRQLLTLPATPAPESDPALPDGWEAPPPPMRVLYLLHPRPHFGLDVIYDGLCRVLGVENVVDWPCKPWLHGAPTREMANYPCTFSHPAHAYTLDDLLQRLEAGYFDCVLYGDVENALDRAVARQISALSRDVPFFLLDQVDEVADMRGRVRPYLKRDHITAYFKREMLAGAHYGPEVYPLPFAYPDHLVLDGPEPERPNPFFWAGHREAGMRRLYLERLEELYGCSLGAALTPEVYQATMRQSRVGLNCFGFGFDTVRYWELPANGCLLLSERLPLQIPANFVDGESAGFFLDLTEL